MKWMRQSSGRSWALPRGARTVGGLRSAGAAWAAWASKDGTIHHLSPSFPAGMAMVRAGVRLSGYDGPSARDRDRQALEQPLYAEVPRSRVTPWLRRTLIAIFFFFLRTICCRRSAAPLSWATPALPAIHHQAAIAVAAVAGPPNRELSKQGRRTEKFGEEKRDFASVSQLSLCAFLLIRQCRL